MPTLRCCHTLWRSLDRRRSFLGFLSMSSRREFSSTQIAFKARSSDASENRLNATNSSLDEKSDVVPSGKSDESVELSLKYFSAIVSDLTKGDRNRSSGLDVSKKKVKVGHIRPALPVSSGNLATYVNESEVLTKLVQLGTDLSRVERNPDICNHLLQTDFNTGIQPYLEFLLRNGVDNSDLGKCLTKSPLLLQEDIDDLQVRVNYLEAKKFSPDAIGRILTKAPLFLTQATKTTDAKLGFLQKTFSLTGEEVRKVITAYPKLSTWPQRIITDMRFVLYEVCGFSDAEQKSMLLFQPKIYTSKREQIEQKFDYLHNIMGLTHEAICQWPQVFRSRMFIIRDRHKFLASIDRAQYDPKEPNYVSLKMLVSGRDGDFCANVAKVPVQEYNSFLKSQ